MARPTGSKNRAGAKVKDNIESVFNRLGGVDHMVEWAMENKTDFYKIYAKLMPTDITVTHVKGSIEEYVESLDDDEFRNFADGIKRLALSSGDRETGETPASIN